MIAIRMKKFYKKTGRRVRVDGKTPVGFDKKKHECFNCHNTGHFARECTTKGTHDGKKKRDSLLSTQEAGKQGESDGFADYGCGIVNWGEHNEAEEQIMHLWAIVQAMRGPQKPEISVSDDNSSEHSSCQSNDSEGLWVNHANHFVPRLVQLIAVRQNVNSVRPNVNTGRANVKSVRQNVNSVKSNVNTVSFNINIVRDKQPIHTSNSNSFSPVRPQDHPLKNMEDRGLEAAKTLAKVLTQRTKTYTRKVKTGLRRKLDADEVNTGEGINTGFTDVNTAFEEIKSGDDEVNSGDESIISLPKIGEEQASLAEIVRLQAQEEAENARKAELQRQDALIAKRVQDELELSETQKNRMAQVQEAAKYYTEEDWDSVRAKLTQIEIVQQSVITLISIVDDLLRDVELINEKKRLYKEQRERYRRNRPMTQAKQREYMINLKPRKLKRTCINLQAEVFKKQKITDVPDVTKDESVKREEEFKVQQPILRYNIRKSLARKGLQKNKSESARSDTEEDVEAYMDERVDEPSSEEFQMGSIPQGSAPAKIVKWQILKTEVDLKEMYRDDVASMENSRLKKNMKRFFMVGDLKTMFDPPSTKDAV
ncbi:ribonuclease H-like domain-containing protein [Tanacetum coccineum]